MIAPLLSCNSSVGSASAPGTGSDGPMARTMTFCGLGSKHNEAADHDVIAGLDEAAGGNIRQLGIDRPIQIVDLHQPDSGAAIRPAHDRGVAGAVRRQRGQDGRLEVVSRWNGAVDNFLPVGCDPASCR